MLVVSARPKLGDRQVKLTHVTEWIEKKIKKEFKVKEHIYLIPLVFLLFSIELHALDNPFALRPSSLLHHSSEGMQHASVTLSLSFSRM